MNCYNATLELFILNRPTLYISNTLPFSNFFFGNAYDILFNLKYPEYHRLLCNPEPEYASKAFHVAVVSVIMSS